MSQTNSAVITDKIPEIPHQLIDFLSQESKDFDLPQKRRKTNSNIYINDNIKKIDRKEEYIVVNQSTLEVKCRRSISTEILQPLKRCNLDLHVHWNHSKRPEYIEVIDYLHHPLFRISVPPREDRPDIFISLFVDKYKCKTPGPCRLLWTEFDISLIRDGDFDIILLSLTIKWAVTTLPVQIIRTENRPIALTKVLDSFFPDPRIKLKSSLNPQELYSIVDSTNYDDICAETIAIPNLKCNLYPFQKRAIQWMLRREGVEWTGRGSLEHFTHAINTSETRLFIQISDAVGKKCYLSHLFGIVTLDIKPFIALEQSVKGGILSEEMGLGKTVEIISLIALHKLSNYSSSKIYDYYTETYIRRTSATLIVTPPSILQQWITEVQKHAPQLKITHYEGIKKYQKFDQAQLLNRLDDSDIVVTTYPILAAEIHFTQLNPKKQLRHQPKYQRPDSPIMKLFWWRCVIDEAQIVESGVSNATVVARMIPRVNAWCVSGTPVKKDVNDLWGLLHFLRFEPYASAKHVWKALLTSHEEFSDLIKKLCIRHSKMSVRDELNLPPQRRYVIMMSFNQVEEQNYQELFREMCNEIGLDIEGKPLDQNWKMGKYYDIMRKWLARLRQAVLHPQMGSKNRKALGFKNGSLQTIDQVLDAMIELTDTSIRVDQRSMFLLKLKRGQLFENSYKIDESLRIWKETADEASIVIKECREELDQELHRVKFEQKYTGSDHHHLLENHPDDGVGQDEVDPTSRLSTLRNRLRGVLEIKHIAEFFLASAYFQIKSNEEIIKPGSPEAHRLEELETQGYEDAKKLRKEILCEVTTKADRLMKRVSEKKEFRNLIEIPIFSSEDLREIKETLRLNSKIVKFAEALDSQAIVIKQWRKTTIQLLLRPLVDEDDGNEITGDEYDNSTKVQEEVMAFVQALRTVICDRYDALTGQTNNLIKDEVSTAIRIAKNGEGPFPEKILTLLSVREQIKPENDISFRKIVKELRSIIVLLKVNIANGSSSAQKDILAIENQLKYAQDQLREQLRVTAILGKEIELFTSVMNIRLEYYRQLQQISDMVSAYKGPTDEKTQDKMLNDEHILLDRITASKSKRRYLCHLHQEATNPSEHKNCVICKEKIEIGTLTVCGHQYCSECISLWWSSHRNCPVCKQKLTQNDIHKIIYRPQQLQIKVDDNIKEHNAQKHSALDPSLKNSALYAEISQSALAKITNIKLNGPSFSTKISTISRHLIWLRDSDPGAKTIIFSQYKEFLQALAVALEQFRIGYSSIDRASGIEKFKYDSSVECFLLHAQAHSSGLNLINANHVILCEPLINTALELQAIARVDRIGQHQETKVWLFIMNSTVEESIHQLSVKRRMEHVDQRIVSTLNNEYKDVDIETKIQEANSIQLHQASFANLLARHGEPGELVASSDLWECLFGCENGRHHNE